jgi:hypothetical protein
MKTWLIIVLAIILIPTLVLGYMGFVPGLSDIMGSNRPRDLGVRYTQADLNSMMAKNGVQDVVLADTSIPEQSLSFSGSKPLKNSFTEAELTARMNDYTKVKYNAVSDMQLRINADGTTEISGRIDLNGAEDCAAAFGMPKQDFDKLKPYLDKAKVLNPKPAFYAKGTVKIVNNQLSMDADRVEIGKLPLPMEQMPMDAVVRESETILANVEGLNIKSLEFKDGKMNFDGTVPAKVSAAIKH